MSVAVHGIGRGVRAWRSSAVALVGGWRPALDAHGRSLCAAAQEAAAPPSKDGERVLTAAANSNIGSLGGAIAHNVRCFGRASIRSMGSEAAYLGVKAVVNASEYLQQDSGVPQTQWLAVTLSETVQEQPRKTGRGFVMVMDARPELVRLAVAGADETDIIVAANTKPGHAAAAIASAIRRDPGTAVVRAMGAGAVHRAMVAAVIAQRYLDNDNRGRAFAVTPSFEERVVAAGEKKGKPEKQLILRLARTQDRRGQQPRIGPTAEAGPSG